MRTLPEDHEARAQEQLQREVFAALRLLSVFAPLTTLVHEKRRRAPNEPRPYCGLVTLCVGVGQGEATIVKWVGK
jgi:hypothetical protein